MTDGSDAFFGPLPAAGVERIGGNIDIRAGTVLMREPAEVTRRKRLLQWHDTLRCGDGILSPKQNGNRLTRSKATGEKISGNTWLMDTLQVRLGIKM